MKKFRLSAAVLALYAVVILAAHLSAEGHYTLVAILAHGNVLETRLIERFANAVGNIG